jgi:hypothetical protein
VIYINTVPQQATAEALTTSMTLPGENVSRKTAQVMHLLHRSNMGFWIENEGTRFYGMVGCGKIYKTILTLNSLR